MEYLGTTLLTIILVVLFIYFTNKNILKKTQSKLDIINRYKIALLKILNESKDDKDFYFYYILYSFSPHKSR
jgi:hypothetical protein